jgi:hypothetical protein
VQDSIDVQDVPNVPPQEELQADNGVPTKYEYPHSGDMMTSQTETTDVAKVFAYMDEAYNKQGAVTETTTYDNPKNHDMSSRMGAKDVDEKPAMLTADLKKKEPDVRENPYSIDEPGAITNNGVADKMETQRPAMTATACGGPVGHN